MKKYCSICKQPLADKNALVCDKCGRPTTPIDIFDRLSADNVLSGKEKKLLSFIGGMTIVVCAISLLQWIIMTASFSSLSGTLTENWNAGLIEQTEENIMSYQMLKRLYGAFITIGIIFIIEQLAMVFLGVMILLKKAWAVQVCRVMYIINAVLYFLSGNIICGIIEIYLIVKLNGILSKMEGGAEYNRITYETAKKAAEIAADPTKWQCRGCGFINPNTVSECKSCGKWKI